MTVAIVAVVALAFAAVAFPAFAAAEPSPEGASSAESTGGFEDFGPRSEEGAVLESFDTSPWQALFHWTQARREEAEPLSIVTLPGPEPESAPSSDSDTPETSAAESPDEVGAKTATVRTASAAATFAGSDTGNPTLFPNSANGKIYGEYQVGLRRKPYECSGSVVDSPEGNVVLTAGHCILDPESGEKAQFVIFVPGYREKVDPYGIWAAAFFAVPETWKQTVGTSNPNEGGDMALLVMKSSEGRDPQDVVGSLGIAFNQACNQIYTQYGYPAEPPYDGEVLYSNTAAYAGPDTNPLFSPEPFKIASDFTQGASGGPWTIGPSSSPTVLSLTDYGYESQPGYLYGAYFGGEAQAAYEKAIRPAKLPAGVEEACRPLPPPVPPPQQSTPSTPTTPTTPPVHKKRVLLKVKKIHRRADGSAIVTAKVSSAGKLKLTGSAVRADALKAPDAGNYKLLVAPKRVVSRKLRRQGGAKVRVKISFASSGTVLRVKKKIHLSRH